MTKKILSKPRITVIDALRGFALLGVILVHMNQHYSYRSMGPFLPHEPILSEWNDTASWLIWGVSCWEIHQHLCFPVRHEFLYPNG